MTHTPGPWRAAGSHVLSVRKDQRTTTTIADCKLSERRRKEGEANARLIAVVPNMLDALVHAEQTIRNLVRYGALSGDYAEIAENEAENLRADIAKAKGEQ